MAGWLLLVLRFEVERGRAREAVGAREESV